MKRMRRFLAGLLLSFAALVPGAGITFAADAVYTGPIRMLYPVADGTYVLIFNANMAACSGGTGYKYMYIRVGQNSVTTDGQKYIVATSMLAFATERAVSVVYDDSSSYCYVNRLSVE